MRMDLYILLDNSLSMNDLLGASGHNKRKIEMLKGYLSNWLRQRKEFYSVHIYTFTTSLVYIGSFQQISRHQASYPDPVQLHFLHTAPHIQQAIIALQGIQPDMSGGTRIWDCLAQLLSIISSEKTSLLCCITDGQDLGSRTPYQDILDLSRQKPGLTIRVMDIGGQLNRNIGDENNIIIPILEYDDLKVELDRMPGKPRIRLFDSLKISLPLLPLSPCSKQDLDLLRASLQNVVPYLEELTGLRYYAVPTCIVNKATLDLFMMHPQPDPFVSATLKEDVLEMLRFFSRVYSTETIDPLSHHQQEDTDNTTPFYIDSELPLEYRHKFLQAAETSLAIFQHLRGEREGVYISSPSFLISQPENLVNYAVNLQQALDLLMKLQQQCKPTLYFSGFQFSSIVEKPDLTIWEQLLSPEQYEEIKTCMNDNGDWKSDIASIIRVYRLALPILLFLLTQLEISKSRWYKIISELTANGSFLPYSSNNEALFNHVLAEQGFPPHFNLDLSGKVLICLETLKEQVEACQKVWPSIDQERILPKLITATLIHEHTHAIIMEGIEQEEKKFSYDLESIHSEKYIRISETLAEWAKMHYFRHDSIMFDIITKHTMVDIEQNWPYAFALRLENNPSYIPARLRFKTLLHYFRFDLDEAYQLLESYRWM